jgi:hypothetical protein
MNVLRAIAGEIVHLFVDDGALALALVLWSAIIGIGVTAAPGFVPAAGPLLFVGCAAILLSNVIRTAKR